MSADTPLAPVPPLTRRPAEVLPPWPPGQRLVRRLAREPLPTVALLRTTGFLGRVQAARIVRWYTGAPAAVPAQVEAAYGALAVEAAALARVVTAPHADGGLGVQVSLVATEEEPYADAEALCGDVRHREAMVLRAASADTPHPLLEDAAVDALRTVHDVLGHVALGLGFDLQSEYAAWLYCRSLFSRAARPAAFCELVGAVATYVTTGVKPALHADLPPFGV